MQTTIFAKLSRVTIDIDSNNVMKLENLPQRIKQFLQDVVTMRSTFQFISTKAFLCGAVAIVGVWTVVPLLSITQLRLHSLTQDKTPPAISNPLFQFSYWYFWAFVTPIVLWLAARFRLERGKWLCNSVIHIFAGALLAALSIVHYGMLRHALNIDIPEGEMFGKSIAKYIAFGFHYDVIKYWCVAGVGFAMAWQKLYRERLQANQELIERTRQLESRLVEAQYQTLQMQIHPHFLFNTLHAISSLMSDDINKARKTVTCMSEMLRLTLDRRNQTVITLAEEMEIVDRYLQIQLIRFSDRLLVTRELDPNSLNIPIPSFIVQPLVENAVKHGLCGEHVSYKIEIRAQVLQGELVLTVRDYGKGLHEIGSDWFKSGTGLNNIRDRLEGYYNGAARLTFNHAEGGGLLVKLVLPVEYDSQLVLA